MKLIEKPHDLMGHLDSLVAIADNYKTEIGFWPPSSLEDAIWRGRLIATIANREGSETVVGFVVFGGVFPNGRIQAVAVEPAFLRQGVAQFLIDNVIAKLESEGYLAVLAKPALDLHVAQKFYEKNCFLKVRTQSGGSARAGHHRPAAPLAGNSCRLPADLTADRARRAMQKLADQPLTAAPIMLG